MTEGGRTFHFEACLGRGGFGEVYRARMRRPSGFETVVAIKVLRADVDPLGQAAHRLRDEARLLGMVRHRAIPRIHDLVDLDGRLALVSEYVDGADLRACLRMAPTLSHRAAVEVAASVAGALHTAWSIPIEGGRPARIVHRDLKPANIRIAKDGAVKLLDFGIAWTDEITRLAHTQTAMLVGSPAYMAPERFDGAAPDPANDVFSLAAVLYESLTLRRLFGELPFKTVAAIALFEDRYDRELAERLPALPADLPPQLLPLLRDMLAWSPTARPSAAHCAEALEALADAMDAPSLSAWCRARAWSTAPGKPGPWTGHVVAEAGPTSAAPAAPAAPPRVPSAYAPPSLTTTRTSLVPAELTTRAILPVSARTLARPSTWLTAGVLSAAAALGLAALDPPRRPAPAPSPGPPSAVQALPAGAALGPPLPPSPPTTGPDAPPGGEAAEPAPTPREVPPAPARAAAPAAPRAEAVAERARVVPRLPAVEALIERPTPPGRPAGPPEATQGAAAADAPQAAPPPPAPPTADALPVTPVGIHPASSAAGITLIGSAGTFVLPARVPGGKYRVMASFDAGVPEPAGALEVAGDAPLQIRCAMGLCRLVP